MIIHPAYTKAWRWADWFCQVGWCGGHAHCGEQACPALGRAAAPMPTASFDCKNTIGLLGLLCSPAQGKPARHNTPGSHIDRGEPAVFLMKGAHMWEIGRKRRLRV